MVQWGKAEVIAGFGIVYRAQCGRFLIDHREGDQEFRLVRFDGGRIEKQPFPQLKQAKEAAEFLVATGG